MSTRCPATGMGCLSASTPVGPCDAATCRYARVPVPSYPIITDAPMPSATALATIALWKETHPTKTVTAWRCEAER